MPSQFRRNQLGREQTKRTDFALATALHIHILTHWSVHFTQQAAVQIKPYPTFFLLPMEKFYSSEKKPYPQARFGVNFVRVLIFVRSDFDLVITLLEGL